MCKIHFCGKQSRMSKNIKDTNCFYEVHWSGEFRWKPLSFMEFPCKICASCRQVETSEHLRCELNKSKSATIQYQKKVPLLFRTIIEVVSCSESWILQVKLNDLADLGLPGQRAGYILLCFILFWKILKSIWPFFCTTVL